MTAADTRPRLSTADIALLRSVLVWARANGWRHKIRRNVKGEVYRLSKCGAEWGHPSGDSIAAYVDHDDAELAFKRNGSVFGAQMFSVPEAIDLLAAYGMIPARFSSAYRAGREAALDRDEWRVTVLWNRQPSRRHLWSEHDTEEDARVPKAERGNYGTNQAWYDGPCAWLCNHCQGSGECPACDGTGDDGSGLDYTCTECGSGSCPYCDEGLVGGDG